MNILVYQHKKCGIINERLKGVNNMMGDLIKTERLSKGLTQSELGKALGLSASTIGMYEQNRRMPDVETLMKLSKILDVSPVYLMGWESFHENTIQTNLRGIENWSNNQFLTKEERESIKMHFAELSARYKALINSVADKKPSLKRFEKHYEEYNKTLDKPISENEIKDLFWKENLNREIEDIMTWVQVFTKYLSGVYESSH